MRVDKMGDVTMLFVFKILFPDLHASVMRADKYKNMFLSEG